MGEGSENDPSDDGRGRLPEGPSPLASKPDEEREERKPDESRSELVAATGAGTLGIDEDPDLRKGPNEGSPVEAPGRSVTLEDLVQAVRAEDLVSLTEALTVAAADLDLDRLVDPMEGRAGRRGLLHDAAAGRGEDAAAIVRELLKAGADPDRLAENGWSPLHFCAVFGRRETVDVLVGAAAAEGRDSPIDRISIPHQAGRCPRTPLQLAVENARVELAMALLDAGADPSIECDGTTLFHLVPDRRDAAPLVPVLARILKERENAAALLDAPDAHGRTPRELAEDGRLRELSQLYENYSEQRRGASEIPRSPSPQS